MSDPLRTRASCDRSSGVMSSGSSGSGSVPAARGPPSRSCVVASLARSITAFDRASTKGAVDGGRWRAQLSSRIALGKRAVREALQRKAPNWRNAWRRTGPPRPRLSGLDNDRQRLMHLDEQLVPQALALTSYQAAAWSSSASASARSASFTAPSIALRSVGARRSNRRAESYRRQPLAHGGRAPRARRLLRSRHPRREGCRAAHGRAPRVPPGAGPVLQTGALRSFTHDSARRLVTQGCQIGTTGVRRAACQRARDEWPRRY